MKNIIKSYIFILLFILFSSYHSFSQAWQWSHQIGSNLWDVSGNIITDSNGNSYSAGTFKGGFCYFPGDTSNIVNGDSDFYLVKFNGSGNLQWWKQFGGNNGTTCNEGVGSLAVSNDNFIYLAGGYCGTTSFGATTLLGSGTEDGFIAKFDDSGNCLWAKNISSYKSDGVGGITVDNAGYVYITGTNNDTANISGFILPPGGFIAKYDTSGNCIWAKKKFSSVPWLGNNYCVAAPQSIKFSNNILTVSGGITNDTVTIDTLTIYTLFPNSDHTYLAQFDTSGNVRWVRIFSGPLAYYPNFEHSVDASGSIYVTGTSTGQGYFQTDTITGPYTAFVVKFDSAGTEQWVRGINSSVGSWGNMVSSDGDGNVYVTGRFRGNTWFGNYNITATTNDDMFIARYNSSGDCLGVRTFGEAEGFGVTQDNQGNAYVCGNFSNTITIGSNTYNSYGNKDVFIAKLDELVGMGDTRQSQNRLLIYANPTAGKCNIVIPDVLVNEKDLWLTLYDNMGRRIIHRKLHDREGKISLNLEHEAKGIYQVSLGNEKVVYYGRIVFE